MKREVFYLVSKWDDNLVFNSRHLLIHLDLVSTLSQFLIVSPEKISEFTSLEILQAHGYSLLPWSLVDDASSTRDLGTRLGWVLAKRQKKTTPISSHLDRTSFSRRQNELRQFALNWAFFKFCWPQKGEYSFSHPSPPCNVLPLFKLPLKNNKHLNFDWRGQGRGVDSFHLLSYPIWVQCLNNFVTDCWSIKDLLHGQKRIFFLAEPQREILSGQDDPNLADQVANQSTGSASV